MSRPRPAPPDTRDRILDAAAHVFARKGYQAASLDEVAREAGLTKGAIYWHFRSKGDLFFALLDVQFQRHTDPVIEDLRNAGIGADPRQALIMLLQAAFARLRADTDWPRLYLEFVSQARDDDLRARLAQFHAQSLAVIAGSVRTLQAAGLAPAEEDPELQASFWSALFDGLMLAWVINPQTDQDALIVRMVDLIWHGIAPQPDDSHRGHSP